MPNTIQEILEDATYDLQKRLERGECANSDEVCELIQELADAYVPSSNFELLEIATDDPWFATTEPETWPAFWRLTPVHFIMANIFEYLWDELLKWYKNQNEY